MYGGSASSGGRWSLGAKTYRAPTEGERNRERQDRLVREAERRKVEEIKHEARHVRKTQELQREVERANARALGMEIGSRSPGMLGGGLGAIGRTRSSSFSGLRSPGMHSLGSPALGGVGLASPRIGGMELASPRIGGLGGMPAAMVGGSLGMTDARRREAELARVRAQRQRLEVEAARRERTASAMRRERAELALANERILASPRLSPMMHSVGVGALGMGGGLGVPGAGLRRTRSWSGGLGAFPSHHQPMHSSPHIVPVPVPVHTPRMSPRILPVGVPTMPRSPRLSGGLGVRPPSPHIVNYNTYNVSPRIGGLGIGGVGGLGAMDDLACQNQIDPLVLDGTAGAMGMPGAFGGGVDFGGTGGRAFVLTDYDFEPGRQILRELGYVQGVGGGVGMMDEEQALNIAIANLTSNAQALGANAVLSVETGEDAGGHIVVRGRAVVLS
ncbi:hypothetical protein JCM11251_007060 [Rhodosporidiobolus azoricus]